MAYEVQVVKSTCTGESVIVKGQVEQLADIDAIYKAVDARMIEMNRRYEAALYLDQYFPPEYRGTFRMIIDAFWKGAPETIPGTVPVPKDHWKKYPLVKPTADGVGEPMGNA
ncbi:MAG TPA: hypothetical protein VF223_12990 [Trebonia sp.]